MSVLFSLFGLLGAAAGLFMITAARAAADEDDEFAPPPDEDEGGDDAHGDTGDDGGAVDDGSSHDTGDGGDPNFDDGNGHDDGHDDGHDGGHDGSHGGDTGGDTGGGTDDTGDGQFDDGHDDGHDGGHDDGHGGGFDDGHDGGHDGGDHGGDDGGMGHGGDDGGMDHGGHSEHFVQPPADGASQAEIDAYVQAVRALEDSHAHGDDESMAAEHMAALGLVPRDDATHIAIGSGDWNDPSNWYNGEIPGDDAKVLIPEGIHLTYGEVSDARLFTVRVDGELEFAHDANSQMILDTMVVSPTGTLTIGTAETPVDPDVDVDIIFANNGPIDTDWDPMLLSRGLIAHGKSEIHGAEKDSHEKVVEDPMAGDTSVRFAEVPEGWQVGDTIVIAGTHYGGKWVDHHTGETTAHPPQDEVRTISEIGEDGTIFFDEPLIYDHDTPREDLHTSVANYTRNVSFETENAEFAEVFERAHIMFMHSDDVDVRYAEFHELGRTDKSEDSFDVDFFDRIEFDSNLQGRYALHLHRAGTDDIQDPAMLVGNAVFGSPGWGFVHHDSNAVLDNNASYDTFGAGFVAETGNEIGAWTDNIAIWAEGTEWAIPKNTTELGAEVFDTARGGDGFWFQGRLVDSTDNIAASVNTGFVYFHRDGDGRMIAIDSDTFEHGEAMYFDEVVAADHAAILDFTGNEAFAAREGLHIVKANPNQYHDVHSTLDDFLAWNVKNGAHLEYTQHYILTNFDVIAETSGEYWTPDAGISIGNNTADLTIADPTITGFTVGIDLNKHFVSPDYSEDLHDYRIINPTFVDVGQEYVDYDPSLDTIIQDWNALPNLAPDIDLTGTLYFADTEDGRTVYIEGTKSDSLGETPFPAGIDTLSIQRDQVVSLLEEKGYWTTTDGDSYVLMDLYFTDRATGEVYYETHPLFIDDAVPLGHETAGGGRYAGAVSNGTQDFHTMDGVLYAGSTPLDVASPVTLIEVTPMTSQSQSMDSMDMHSEATEPDLWETLTAGSEEHSEDMHMHHDPDEEMASVFI